MNQFIESLRRLYENEKIDDKKLNELLVNKKINKHNINSIKILIFFNFIITSV